MNTLYDQESAQMEVDLHDLEVDTLEIDEIADVNQRALSSGCSSSTCSSTCSACGGSQTNAVEQ